MSTPSWFKTAESQTGVTETPGPKTTPKIALYHACTTLRATDDEVPWCASFVCWCLEENDIQSTRSAAARSFSKWGHECKPRVGAIVVVKRGTQAWQGHVGFLSGWSDDYVWLISGNYSDTVRVSRHLRGNVVAIRWPGQAPSSKPVIAGGTITVSSVIAAVSSSQHGLDVDNDVYRFVMRLAERIMSPVDAELFDELIQVMAGPLGYTIQGVLAAYIIFYYIKSRR